MRSLNDKERADLELLTKHQWFKLLKELISEFETDVLKSLKRVNTWNKEHLAVLNAKQNYLLWLEDLINTLEAKTNKVWKREFK